MAAVKEMLVNIPNKPNIELVDVVEFWKTFSRPLLFSFLLGWGATGASMLIYPRLPEIDLSENIKQYESPTQASSSKALDDFHYVRPTPFWASGGLAY